MLRKVSTRVACLVKAGWTEGGADDQDFRRRTFSPNAGKIYARDADLSVSVVEGGRGCGRNPPVVAYFPIASRGNVTDRHSLVVDSLSTPKRLSHTSRGYSVDRFSTTVCVSPKVQVTRVAELEQ